MKATIRASITGKSTVGVCQLLEQRAAQSGGPNGRDIDPSKRLRALLDECEKECRGDAVPFSQVAGRLSCDLVREALELLNTAGLADAEDALWEVCSQLEDALKLRGQKKFDDRARDIHDLCQALIRRMRGQSCSDTWTQQTVLVSCQIPLPDALEAARKGIAAVIVREYNPFSHAAIILRAANITVAAGVDNFLALSEGAYVALDARNQRLLLEPTEAEARCFREASTMEAVRESGQEVPLKDGTILRLSFNCMGSFEALPCQANIGLLRTEFFCIALGRLPSEAEMIAEYAAIVERYRSVTIRLFDFGGDKSPDATMRVEGRGIRYLLTHREVLKAQLRAILRVASRGDVRILLPMVSSVGEVVQVRRLAAACQQELEDEGVRMSSLPPVGAMIETPAAAIIADQLSEVVDFASIGTNDLCAATMGIRREELREIEVFPEPLSRLIVHALREMRARQKPVTACGNLSSTPEGVMLFTDNGLREICIDAQCEQNIRKIIMNKI